jgi:hypothetical protein
MSQTKKLIAIVEQGGYPNFTALYQRNGYEVTMAHAMRKAINIVKKILPDVIVAEFNYQSDFRDRTSSLESLLATVDRLSHGANAKVVKVIVFYEKEYIHQLEKLQAVFSNFETLAYPIQDQDLEQAIK